MTARWQRRASAVAALVIAALVMALAGLAWREVAHLHDAEQGRVMINALEQFQEELDRALLAQRDFLLTDSPTNLVAYHALLGAANNELVELRNLARANPAVLEYVTRLEHAAQASRHDFDDAIARYSRGASATTAVSISAAGSRPVHRAIDDLELRLHDDVKANSQELSTALFYTMPGLLLLLAFLAPFAAYWFANAKNELLAGRRSQQALTATNAELEARVQKRTADLAASEQRFRQMAETIDDVFWITSPDAHELHYVSPAFERIWGRRCSELSDG